MEELKHLEKLPFWKQLTDSERELMQTNAMLQKYTKGQLIYNSGAECSGMMMLLSGELRVSIISEEGREITLYRMYEGEFCALSASCILSQITFDTHMAAAGDSVVLVVNAYSFEKLMKQNIYVRCFVYELLSERFSSVMWTMQMILFQGYDRRLASFFIQEYERTGLKTIQMTHEQLAQYTNSAREVVTRMLRRFADDGLVEFKRGRITLTDIAALRLLTSE